MENALGDTSTLTTEQKQPPTLAGLTGPPGPVINPIDCLGYARQLPSDWHCPICPLARACYEALKARQNGGSNGQDAMV
jgi:rubredoxin